MTDPQAQAAILSQALPYLQSFRGHTFVVKYGGSVMRDSALMEAVIRNILLLQLVGIKPILVHGGGPEIDRWLEKAGIPKQVVGGLRVTTEDAMEIVEMALSGKANKSLVSEVQKAGGKAIGLSGRDGNLMIAEKISDELGCVGKVIAVQPEALHVIAEAGFVPVVCSVASSLDGQALNVNADSAASAVAAAVGASKLILMTDAAGVLSDKNNPTSTMNKLSVAQAQGMIDSGAADKGMIPKLEAALFALNEGVGSVHFIDGRVANSLLIEIFTDAGIGTMMSR